MTEDAVRIVGPSAAMIGRQMSMLTRAQEKVQALAWLVHCMRVASNWPQILQQRRDPTRMPPICLRSGEILHHGPRDNPWLLIDEVWVNQWYALPAVPPSNALMIDIGANIGSVTMYWAHRAPSLRIHCYEPNPDAIATLRTNIEKNGLATRASIYSEGVGRTAGLAALWVDVPTDLSTAYAATSPAQGGRRIDVPIVGIDEVWNRTGQSPVWLLKIDTEGAESDILEGASKNFLASVRYAIVEYHDNIVANSLARCQRVLEGAGFTCRARHHPWNEGIIYAERIDGGDVAIP